MATSKSQYYVQVEFITEKSSRTRKKGIPRGDIRDEWKRIDGLVKRQLKLNDNQRYKLEYLDNSNSNQNEKILIQNSDDLDSKLLSFSVVSIVTFLNVWYFIICMDTNCLTICRLC